ncbi:MAG TPA: alcohol dehydrogenase catalytic domain-containing protein [Alphaproteobacteria bacterium]|nr:alcohol dehydrogenase catalytic domain-containing protein [Alphaproteobacteria bacterium]
MKAAVAYGGETIRIEELPLPSPGVGELVVRVRACGLCGSDLAKMFHNKLVAPTVLGHEIAGEVTQAGIGVTRFKEGDRVVVAHHVPCFGCHYCRHGNFSMCRSFKQSNLHPGGFAEAVLVPATHVNFTTLPLPDHLSFEQASFTEPLACCLRSLRRWSLQPADVVLLVGLGAMGLLMAQLVQAHHAVALGIDLDERRVDFARGLGVRAVCSASDRAQLMTLIQTLTDGRGCDVVVLTAGHGGTLQEALGWVRDGGTITLFGNLSPQPPVQFDPNLLYYREIALQGSYSPSPLELVHALHLIEVGGVDVEPLITHRLPLEGLPQAVELARTRRAVKAIINPQSSLSPL